VAERGGLSGEAEHHRGELERLLQPLAHPDATIGLFDPNYRGHSLRGRLCGFWRSHYFNDEFSRDFRDPSGRDFRFDGSGGSVIEDGAKGTLKQFRTGRRQGKITENVAFRS